MKTTYSVQFYSWNAGKYVTISNHKTMENAVKKCKSLKQYGTLCILCKNAYGEVRYNQFGFDGVAVKVA